MRYGDNELYVPHAFTTHFLLGDLNTAPVADNTFVAYTLVLSAMAFVVLYRTKNALTEQAVAFGLVCTVVDGFRLEDLAG